MTIQTSFPDLNTSFWFKRTKRVKAERQERQTLKKQETSPPTPTHKTQVLTIKGKSYKLAVSKISAFIHISNFFLVLLQDLRRMPKTGQFPLFISHHFWRFFSLSQFHPYHYYDTFLNLKI